jgi:hypothetical protein
MITTQPYNPTTDDMFLYEDHEVTWSGGSTIYKRAYAWNPNGRLYGYRRSLEGLAIPYRTFSTEKALLAAPDYSYYCDQVNPKSDPVNKPLWWNSWPPLSRMVSKNHLLMCAHCFFSPTNVDRQAHLGQTLDNLYTPGSSLNARLNLRFIDGDDNAIDIPKTEFEYPYTYDSGATGPFITSALTRGTGGPLRSQDMASSVMSSGFPFNPLTQILPNSRPTDYEPYLLNAGNLTVQRGRLNRIGRLGAALPGVELLRASPYDVIYLHDSGTLFAYPLSEPTSPEAGDGVLGIVWGHVEFPFRSDTNHPDTPRFAAPPRTAPYQPFQPGIVEDGNDAMTDFRNYWIERGYPFPQARRLPKQDGFSAATIATVNELRTKVQTILSVGYS